MDGIYCSNHGGRQANGGVPAIDCLPDVVAATAGDVPVLFDSGIRSGTDVVKALALGATAVGIGRPYAYGAALGGTDGIVHVLRSLLAEADLLMAVDGYPSLDDLTPRRCAACDSERHVAPIDHRQPPAREAADVAHRARRTARQHPAGHHCADPRRSSGDLPIGFARIGDELVIHGSTGSPWLRQLADGAAAAVSVTTLDGVMVARCGFESSFRFRSAVLFGTFERIGDEDKVGYLDQLVDTFIPGRVAELRASSRKGTGRDHGAAHADRGRQLVAEGRRRLARGLRRDIAAGVWAGVVPLTTVYGDPERSPDCDAAIPVPPSVRAMRGPLVNRRPG